METKTKTDETNFTKKTTAYIAIGLLSIFSIGCVVGYCISTSTFSKGKGMNIGLNLLMQ